MRNGSVRALHGGKRGVSEVEQVRLPGRTILIPMVDIHPSPENAKLYRQVSSDDPDVLALGNSIAEPGLLEPLVVTRDHCHHQRTQTRH